MSDTPFSVSALDSVGITRLTFPATAAECEIGAAKLEQQFDELRKAKLDNAHAFEMLRNAGLYRALAALHRKVDSLNDTIKNLEAQSR